MKAASLEWEEACFQALTRSLRGVGVGVREGRQSFDLVMSPASLPGAAPSLQDEVREAEAGRLKAVERENRELRGQLQMLQAQLGSQVGPSVSFLLTTSLPHSF